MLDRHPQFGQDVGEQVGRILVGAHHEGSNVHSAIILREARVGDKLPVSRWRKDFALWRERLMALQ